ADVDAMPGVPFCEITNWTENECRRDDTTVVPVPNRPKVGVPSRAVEASPVSPIEPVPPIRVGTPIAVLDAIPEGLRDGKIVVDALCRRPVGTTVVCGAADPATTGTPIPELEASPEGA